MHSQPVGEIRRFIGVGAARKGASGARGWAAVLLVQLLGAAAGCLRAGSYFPLVLLSPLCVPENCQYSERVMSGSRDTIWQTGQDRGLLPGYYLVGYLGSDSRPRRPLPPHTPQPTLPSLFFCRPTPPPPLQSTHITARHRNSCPEITSRLGPHEDLCSHAGGRGPRRCAGAAK